MEDPNRLDSSSESDGPSQINDSDGDEVLEDTEQTKALVCPDAFLCLRLLTLDGLVFDHA